MVVFHKVRLRDRPRSIVASAPVGASAKVGQRPSPNRDLRSSVLAYAVGFAMALGCDPRVPAATPSAEPVPASQAAAVTTPSAAEPTHAAVAPGQPGIDPSAATTPAVVPVTAAGMIEDERNTIGVFQAAEPATVFVTQKTRVVDRYSLRTAEIPAGAGTGFVWDREGHIVTNCHVAMQDCQRGIPPSNLSVTLFDHKDYPAKLVGIDGFHDIAVLKIDAGATELVPIRRPPRGYLLEVGQKAVAIGNPFGLDHTLTVGVISAMGREVKGIGGFTIRGMVQTDAAINPGNSGGPLLDSRGQLIGMNTMIFSASGSSAGIGFAVPLGTIERVVPQIIRTGRPEQVGLGVEAFDDQLARRFGIEGVIIQRVTPGSPAAQAGIRNAENRRGVPTFDVVVAIDGKPIRNFDDLYGSLDGRRPGDVVTVSVRRFPPDEVVTVKVPLAKLNQR